LMGLRIGLFVQGPRPDGVALVEIEHRRAVDLGLEELVLAAVLHYAQVNELEVGGPLELIEALPVAVGGVQDPVPLLDGGEPFEGLLDDGCRPLDGIVLDVDLEVDVRIPVEPAEGYGPALPHGVDKGKGLQGGLEGLDDVVPAYGPSHLPLHMGHDPSLG